MLTGKEALQWVTSRSTPPWRMRELSSSLLANPIRPFSVMQGITALDNAKSVLFTEIRNPSLLKFPPEVFQRLNDYWNFSIPSRNTLGAVISLLGAHGASLNYLSGDRKTAAIVSTLGNLKTFGGYV